MTEQADSEARQGYLLLADISGYTAFLTGTELEHSHAIIRELTKLIRARLAPPMRFVKLEGDAVFCYAEAGAFANGERFVELIEVCYFGFSNRLLDMMRATTCRCDACKAIPTLGLKFVTHFGTFMIERDDDGREDLAGPDVILVHRLLKNTISDAGGPQAYAFFTEACRQRLPPSFVLPQQSETYDSFGETTGGVHDLEPIVEEMREARREYIGPDDADLDASMELPFPPSIVWQYFVDPDKRLRWQTMQTSVKNQPNERGRQGVGSSSHCAHGVGGDVLREYLDWRPYNYYTHRFTPLPNGFELAPPAVETIEFFPLEDGGTSVHWRWRLRDRGPEVRQRFEVSAAAMRADWPVGRERLLRAIEEDAAALGVYQQVASPDPK